MSGKNIRLLKNHQISNTVKANGLAPIIGYEPWAGRTIDSLRQTLCDDVPVLIRVHPAADYPCNNEEDAYKLDMESHSILIVGYDDENQMFDVVNPWNKEWGGEYGGIEKLPYDIIPITCVNASYGKGTRFALPQKKITSKVDRNGNASIHLLVGYYMPNGYIIDEKLNQFTNLEIEVNYEVNGETKKYNQSIGGMWPVGKYIETDIPLGKEFNEVMDIKFNLSLTLEGKRPYSYQDTIGLSFEESLNFAHIGNYAEQNNKTNRIKTVNR